jgi:hypothetical protein
MKEINVFLTCITNLTCDGSIMKIMRSSFIHSFVHFTHEYHALKTHLTRIYKKRQNLNDIHSFIHKCINKWSTNLWMNECHTNFASSYKSTCQMCFQYMISMRETYNLWMKSFCTISIIKLWNVKFVMWMFFIY